MWLFHSVDLRDARATRRTCASSCSTTATACIEAGHGERRRRADERRSRGRPGRALRLAVRAARLQPPHRPRATASSPSTRRERIQHRPRRRRRRRRGWRSSATATRGTDRTPTSVTWRGSATWNGAAGSSSGSGSRTSTSIRRRHRPAVGAAGGAGDPPVGLDIAGGGRRRRCARGRSRGGAPPVGVQLLPSHTASVHGHAAGRHAGRHTDP